MDSINAGEFYSGQCPEGQTSKLVVGEKIPNSEKALVKVLKVEGGKYTLGPLRAGEIIISVPCDSSIQELAFLVNEMPPEAAMNRYSPLGAERVEYPTSFFILILVLVLSLIGGGLIYFVRKRKITLKKTPLANKKLSAREHLKNEIEFLEKNITLPESHHFHQSYKRLRKFIEHELNLKTRSLTTQEFLGTFRALALQQSSNQSFSSILEYLLRTADDVRFAGKAVSPEIWKDYLEKMRSVLSAFPEREPK